MSRSSNKDYFIIGEIVRPHGVVGEVKVNPLTEDPSRFKGMKKCYMRLGETYTPVDILGVKAGNDIILKLQGVSDRNAAEKLRGTCLYVDRAHAIKLPEGRYFISDLEGLEVYTDREEYVGCLTEVLQPGANDVYIVKREGATVYMPALKTLILEVDIAANRMQVSADRLAEVALIED